MAEGAAARAPAQLRVVEPAPLAGLVLPDLTTEQNLQAPFAVLALPGLTTEQRSSQVGSQGLSRQRYSYSWPADSGSALSCCMQEGL